MPSAPAAERFVRTFREATAARALAAAFVTSLLLATFAGACTTAGGGADTTTDADAMDDGAPNGSDQTPETVAGDFDTIWSLAWGSDGQIWVSEREGRISRVNPETGAKTLVGRVRASEVGEGGLMGIALHPDFRSHPWVYAAHTYVSARGQQNRVVRMRYSGGRLGEPEVLLDGIPASSIHDGGRLAIGPDRLLYVTTGDAAGGDQAQDRRSLAGKVLRLTLDGRAAPGNPFGTVVYSFGHRNPQGLVFAPSGVLYASEHGPGDNDEVNVIRAGGNYGWPEVRGRCDGGDGLHEAAFCRKNRVVEPLITWTPTIAPAGLAYYDSDRIAGWRGSLLMTSLKGSALYRLTLSPDGTAITASEPLFQGTFGRLRDVLVAPDGVVYLATSNRDGRGSSRPGDDRIIRIGR